MSNEIVKKTTSLMLMTIMIAGGLTIAIPSTIPDAMAQTPNLTVSAVNNNFRDSTDNRYVFGGLQVIEVIVNDPNLRDATDPSPNVQINDERLTMQQAPDGAWYGYFADQGRGDEDNQASMQPFTGNIDYDHVSGAFTNAHKIGDPRDAWTSRAGVTAGTVINSIQYFDFDDDDDVDVVFSRAGSPQTVNLRYDESFNSDITLDRSNYPREAQVYISVRDHVLNIDPTTEDVWYWNTFDLNATQHTAENYGANVPSNFNEISTLVRETEAGVKHYFTSAALGCEENCLLTIPTSDDIIEFTPQKDSNPKAIKFVETGVNTGIFEIADPESNGDTNGKLMTKDDAPRGTNTQISYNDIDRTLNLLLSNADMSITVDGDWNSGEIATLTVIDPDQNKDSQEEDNQEVSNPAARIPTFMTGEPFMLKSSMNIKLFSSLTDSQNTSYINFDDRRTTPITYHSIGGVNNTGLPLNATDKSDKDNRLIIETPSTFADTPESIVIWFGMTFNEFLAKHTNVNDDDFIGKYMLNVDVSSLGDSKINIIGTAKDNELNINQVRGGVQIGGSPGGHQMALIDLASAEQVTRLIDMKKLQGTVTNASIGTDQMGIIIQPETAIKVDTKYPIVFDLFRFGFTGDGAQASERFADQIIRVEVEETDENTGRFTGTLEYIMVNQLIVNDDETYTDMVPIGNEVKFVAFEDLTGSDSRINYNDINENSIERIVSTQKDIKTSTGIVRLSTDRFSPGGNVEITLEDADLNTDSTSRETYLVVTGTDTGKDRDQVGIDVPTAHETIMPGGLSLGMLLEVNIDDNRWTVGTCTLPTGVQTGLGTSGFTLLETVAGSGVFKGTFRLPSHICVGETSEPISGKDISIKYLDFRDESGQIITIGDTAAITTFTGTITLDRTVYPVPFSNVETGSHMKDKDDELLPASDTRVYVRVHDPDYNLNPSGEDDILESGNGPVKVTISRSGDECIIGYAGGDTSDVTENPEIAALKKDMEDKKAIYDADKTDVTKQIDYITAKIKYDNSKDTGGQCPISEQFGELTETTPESGIFEVEVDLAYNNGPNSNECPGKGICILQGDIITVEYTDPTDSTGSQRTVSDSATFDLRNAVLQTDKTSYVIGTDMIVTLIDPDLDLDGKERETYPLNIVRWDSKAGELNLDDTTFDAEPGSFRETGDSTGIFRTIITMPVEIDDEKLNRGEEVTLEYTDYGPAGADYVGDNTEDIERTLFTSNFGATIELDQAVYTWTDKIFITITAPDHNLDRNTVDEIGNTDDNPVRIGTRSNHIDQYALVETETNSGVFKGEVTLTGFDYDADGDTTTGNDGNDVNGEFCRTCVGPTDGKIPADNEDGLEISFEYSEKEFVRKSALIRWNQGEVQWLQASYPATSTGVLRIIDPDMNLNPAATDNFEVNVWSSSSPSGITLTVTETQPASGVFEGAVSFGLSVNSGGHKLNVDEGDIVTARYVDNTLPDPYGKSDSLAITSTVVIGTIIPPLERVTISDIRILDSKSETISSIMSEQQVQVTVDLTNNQDRSQAFAYLVQIQDSDDITEDISWIEGNLTPNQSFSSSQSWTPSEPGEYTITVFAWESLTSPTALSPQKTLTVTVN